jgi:hypothetical protein
MYSLRTGIVFGLPCHTGDRTEKKVSKRVIPVTLTALMISIAVPTTAYAGEPAPAAPPPAAMATSPGGPLAEPALRPVPAPPSSVSRSRADCARTAQHARQNGQARTSTCVSLELAPAPKPLTDAQRKAVAVVLPECTETSTPNTGWWASSRREACTHRQFSLTVTEVPSGKELGKANLHATLEMSASGTGWSSTIYMWVWDASGIGFPEFASGNLFGCSGCTGTSTFVPDGPDDWRGSGNFQASLPAGTVRKNLTGSWELTVGSSKWSNTVLFTLNLPAYRCDNAIGNRVAGCVLPTIPGVVGFSQSRNPLFVQHVYDAQISGLVGRYGSGTYLTKLDDPAKVRQNGDKACPTNGSLPRPSGHQCDEYPFRSTYQGASTSGATTARSHPWCQMPDPQGSGPSGWSRCFIPSGQNGSGGALLGAFYSDERIMDGDPFQVGYLP